MSTNESSLGQRARVALVLVVFALLGGAGSAAAAPITAERIFDRELEVWFGTLSVVGVAAPSQDFLELSDLIGLELRQAIQFDPTVDVRVTNDIAAWERAGQSGIEWVLGTPTSANFPAQQNLLNAFAAAAAALDAAFGPGSLAIGTASLANQREYSLGSFDTIEIAPVFVGDTDNPILFGQDGEEVTITNNFIAQAGYFEQNAVWTGTAIPEPATVGLLLMGLAGLGCARRRTS